MKTEEDEAFDELARRQGMWGGGFPSKRQMAADKLLEPVHCQCFACKDGIIHASDCAVHNGPAYPVGPCDCGVKKTRRGAMDEEDDDIQVYKKPWVGLTLDEIEELFQSAAGADEETDIRFARLIEAKLKEKNT